MSGWEAVAQAGQEFPGFAGWQAQLMDLAVNDLGINRIRLEIRAGAENTEDWWSRLRSGAITEAEWRTKRYATVNDNADPTVVNPAGFHFSELDFKVQSVVLPLKQRLEARGERLYLNLNYVAFSPGTGYVHLDPYEYAELMLVTFEHLRDTFGIVPDAIEIILEPDNATPWRGTSIGQAIAITGGRLRSAGFDPEFIAPSVTNMANTVPFLDLIVAVPDALQFLSEIAYHRYGGVSDANLAAIATRGSQYGLRTAMLEHIGSGVEDLYKDLTIANASGWEQYTLAFPTSDNGAQYYVISNGQPVMGSRTRALRQYFRHVRFGAFRVQATSDRAAVRPVGFTNVGGGPVVVLHVDAAQTFAIEGLRPGTYRITSSSPSAETIGDVTAGADGVVRFASSVTGIITVAFRP